MSQITLDQQVERLLEILRTARRVCGWCRHPDEPVKQKRLGLCSHCARIRRELNRLERAATEDGLTNELDFRLRVQRQKVEQCKGEGWLHQHLLDDGVSGLRIEHDLRDISKRLVGKELFIGYADWFDKGFTEDQLVLLHYFLTRVVLEYHRKNRFKTALFDAAFKSKRGEI
jgi:hypothetical protein